MIPADEIEHEIARIGADRVSGATALVLRGIAVLRSAPHPQARRSVALALCTAQPSMAGFRTAAALAVASDDPDQALAGLASRIDRAPAAIARVAVPLIRLRSRPTHPLRVVTCSSSGAVEATLRELGRAEPLFVSCSAGLPAREGLGLAERLAASGTSMEVYTDAGLGAALPGADALVVGADAVSAAGFINKVGTAALAALAHLHGVPVFVLAGREKILPPEVFESLPLREGLPDELDFSLKGCLLRNPLFERVPAAVSADLVTDGGPVPVEASEAACFWTSAMRRQYMSIVHAGNMLDKR